MEVSRAVINQGLPHEIFFSPFLGVYGLFSSLARKVESLFKGLKSPSLFFRAFALSSSPSLEKRNLTPEEKKKEDLSYKVLEDLGNSNIESLKAYVNEDNINEQLINGSTILIIAVEISMSRSSPIPADHSYHRCEYSTSL